MNYLQRLAAGLIQTIDQQLEYAKARITDDGSGELTTHLRNGEMIYFKRFRKSKRQKKDHSEELGPETDPRTIQVLESRFYQKQTQAMENSRKVLEHLLKNYEPFDAGTILASLPQVYRKPLQRRMTDLAPADAVRWANAPYQKNGKSCNAPYYKLKSGLYVKSHGEFLIGSALEARGIPFRYEMELDLIRPDGSHERKCPDFSFLSLSHQVIHMEHFGMLDKTEYRRDNARKLLLYMDNGIFPGINLILTADPPGRHITPEEIEQVIDLQLIPMLQQ